MMHDALHLCIMCCGFRNIHTKLHQIVHVFTNCHFPKFFGITVIPTFLQILHIPLVCEVLVYFDINSQRCHCPFFNLILAVTSFLFQPHPLRTGRQHLSAGFRSTRRAYHLRQAACDRPGLEGFGQASVHAGIEGKLGLPLQSRRLDQRDQAANP